MQGMSYEKRIALGNQVPTLGQFQVIKQIPQYQTCEVHNLVPAPKDVPETLKHVVFNIERGVTLPMSWMTAQSVRGTRMLPWKSQRQSV